MALWLQRYHETGDYGHRPLLIAPDTEYSRPGLRWVMFYTHKPGAFAQYDKVSYSVPVDQVGPLLWAWYESPVDLPRFDAFRASGKPRLSAVDFIEARLIEMVNCAERINAIAGGRFCHRGDRAAPTVCGSEPLSNDPRYSARLPDCPDR